MNPNQHSVAVEYPFFNGPSHSIMKSEWCKFIVEEFESIKV